jgi:hypothetical protein
MRTLINIDNYEEIMFRLVEDDFDKQTRTDLLQQIEADELFKFEWESWQKTKFTDPLENYSAESSELTEKIILIAEPKVTGRKRIIYYWAVAASIILLIGTLFLLTADFSSTPKPEIAEAIQKTQTPVKKTITTAQSQPAPAVISDQKHLPNQKEENQTIIVAENSNTFIPTENTLAEIPILIDSVPVISNELAKATDKKPRYTITIETSDIGANNLNNNEMAQNQKANLKKVFTNTKMFLSRKPNGEPDKIYLIGDENSYVCININY